MDIQCNSKVGTSGINGDFYYISKDQTLCVLGDGASGASPDGKTLYGKIIKAILEDSHPIFSSEWLDHLIIKINNRLIEVSQVHHKKIFGTLVVCLFKEDELLITSIGDSPSYLLNDTIQRLSKNENRYEWMIDIGHITRKEYEGYIENMHPMMWSCFTNFLPMIVPNHVIKRYRIKDQDHIFICTDGISDYLSQGEILQFIEQPQALMDLSRKRALVNKYVDDQTYIWIKRPNDESK